MANKICSVITGTGSYIPARRQKNEDFLSFDFFDSAGNKIETPTEDIVNKFEEITTIAERRYADNGESTSDMAKVAAERAIEAAGIDKEELDYIIVAHNFGETHSDNNRIDTVPSLAARVKSKLGIANPYAVAYDVLFGCPGWVQGVIQADYFIKSGDAKKVLVIGADILSNVSDPHDRDSMIYADGAGAAVLEGRESETPIGILGHNSRTDALQFSNMLHMGYSYCPRTAEEKNYYLKMNGRRLYQYALENVPITIKAGLDKLNMSIDDIQKVLIHQANGKMDDAILERLFKLYGKTEIPEQVMPMTISWLGNSSVATVPTLLDIVWKGKLKPHNLTHGDTVVFASVGAGMSINSVIYRFP